MSDASHVVLGNNSVRCLNCGTEQPIAMPSSLSVMVAISKAFTKEHKACKPSERGAARMRYATPAEWLRSWDTGVSSLTIYMVMTGEPIDCRPDVPHDPADFARCYRLLKAFPEWRARIDEMRKVKGWSKLVDNWERLEFLFEQEAPSGKCPQLYECLKRCRGE